MTNRSRFPLSAALALSIAAAAAPGVALAQDGAGTPPPPADPATTTTPAATPPATEGMAGAPAATAARSAGGLTNDTGQVFVNANVGINLSKEQAAKPISVVPNIYYGVNDDLTVGITHGQLPGFPPLAGGVCLGGEDRNCPKVYNNLNLDVLFSFLRQEGMQVAAHGGIDFVAFSPELLMAVRVGAAAQFRAAGALGIVVDPSLRIGVTKREIMGIPVNKEFLSVPVRIGYDVTEQLNVGLFTGIFGPTSHFGDFYQVPLGLGGMFAIDQKMGVGAQFIFTNLGGKVGDGEGRADGRGLVLTFNFRT